MARAEEVIADASLTAKDGWPELRQGSLHHHRLSGRRDGGTLFSDTRRRRTQDQQHEEGQ